MWFLLVFLGAKTEKMNFHSNDIHNKLSLRFTDASIYWCIFKLLENSMKMVDSIRWEKRSSQRILKRIEGLHQPTFHTFYPYNALGTNPRNMKSKIETDWKALRLPGKTNSFHDNFLIFDYFISDFVIIRRGCYTQCRAKSFVEKGLILITRFIK